MYGVIERRSIRLNRLSSQHALTHLFHTVAVACVAGDAQQIASNFEVRISPAWSFKAVVGSVQAIAELAFARPYEASTSTHLPGA